MDTLLIVRKIREAESLADSGKHGDARSLLEPLLGERGLTETHKQLITKKLELFSKQQQRMTRVMSRRGTSVLTRDPDASSERTAIRSAIDVDKSERPTDHTVEKDIEKGAATEVVPKARNVETEIPQVPRSHKLTSVSQPDLKRPGVHPALRNTDPPAASPVERPAASPVERPPTTSIRDDQIKDHYSGNWPKVVDSKVRLPASESQELAPLADPMSDEPEDDDPRKTDIFKAPSSTEIPRGAATEMVPRLDDPDDESAPVISRYSTPGGTHDTPVPQSHTPAAPVRDSIVHPKAPSRNGDDDSTYLLADEHFATRVPSSRGPRSNPELKALADRLPDDDLRRELALEIVKLRSELDSVRTGKVEPPAPGTRKVKSMERPESGSFHIPASQVNTIVRRAAGTDSIEVHMPSRDEEAAELQVLRRDSVRGKAAEKTPTDRIALAQDYIDARNAGRPSIWRPVATYLGFAVVVGLVVWAVHIAWQSISAESAPTTLVFSENGGDDYEIGRAYTEYEDLRGISGVMARQVTADSGWVIQHNADNVIVGVALAGPASKVPEAAERFGRLKVHFGVHAHEGADWSLATLIKVFGEPKLMEPGKDPEPYSEAQFKSLDGAQLRWEARQSTRALDVYYRSSTPDRPVWVRVGDATVQLPEPRIANE